MRLPVVPLALLLGLTPSGAGLVWAQPALAGGSVPVPLATVQVVYPAHVEVAWQHGEVRVAFVVDAQGQPEQVEVLAGAHPAFVEATLDALLATPYRPAQRGGQAVPMRVTRVVRFSMQDGGLGAVLGPGLPVEADARLAIAPAVQQAVWPVYPSALLRAGVSGRARVRLEIGAAGEVLRQTLLAASHPDFGAATLAMLQAWRFTPAGQAGHLAQLDYEQVFDAERPARAGVPATAAVLIGRLAAGEPGGAGAGELDAPLRVLRRVAPLHAAPGPPPDARAVLDFHVDPLGRVLLPELVSASDPGFGWAALTALNQWRFAPPRRGGQATLARGRVELQAAAPRP